MARIWRVAILVTIAMAALSSAATAAQASGRTAMSRTRSVATHITVKATIPVGTKPFGIAADPRTKRIYVANLGSRTVSVISARTDTVVATIRVGRVPVGVATDPRTNTIYVTNERSDTVSVISGRTDAVIATVHGGFQAAFGIAADPRTNTIYLADGARQDLGDQRPDRRRGDYCPRRQRTARGRDRPASQGNLRHQQRQRHGDRAHHMPGTSSRPLPLGGQPVG
jgi:YVTN family beta-propeller protein